MCNYYLDLIGLRILLQTPYEITVTDRLQPFLTRGFNRADCVIKLNVTDTLPDISNNALCQGLDFYSYSQNQLSIFHCEKAESKPFAVTVFENDGNVRLDVLKNFTHYFTGSSGIFNRIGMENLLQQYKGMLLHASFIKYDQKGILFIGPSGVGKSTQAGLWEKFMGAEIINGDRSVIRNTENGWFSYGSPYAGTSGIYINKNAPVTALVVLKKAGFNRITPLNPALALKYAYPEISIHRWDKNFVLRITDLFLEFASEIPVVLLECEPTKDSVLLLKEGLNL